MREIRKERDATMKALNESRLEEHAWKQEVGTWKATVCYLFVIVQCELNVPAG